MIDKIKEVSVARAKSANEEMGTGQGQILKALSYKDFVLNPE